MGKDERRRIRRYHNKQNATPLAMNPKYQWKCYEHFRLMWMLSHGFTLTDLVKGLEEEVNEWLGEQGPGQQVEYLPDVNLEALFDKWVADTGFNGEVWPCFREFMDCEFQECGYSEGKGGVRP